MPNHRRKLFLLFLLLLLLLIFCAWGVSRLSSKSNPLASNSKRNTINPFGTKGQLGTKEQPTPLIGQTPAATPWLVTNPQEIIIREAVGDQSNFNAIWHPLDSSQLIYSLPAYTSTSNEYDTSNERKKLYLYTTKGTKTELYTSKGPQINQLHFHPSGGKLFFETFPGSLFEFDLETKSATTLYTTEPGITPYILGTSNNSVCYAPYTPAYYSLDEGFGIYCKNLITQETEKIWSGGFNAGNYGTPVVHPDTDRIIVGKYTEEGILISIAIINTLTGAIIEEKKFNDPTISLIQPGWAGANPFYVTKNTLDVYSLFTGKTLTNITTHTPLSSPLRVFFDKSVSLALYSSEDRAGNYALYYYNLKSRIEYKLPFERGMRIRPLGFNADGSKIAYEQCYSTWVGFSSNCKLIIQTVPSSIR